MHSLNKGKRGELEFAKLCTYEGYPSRRTQQYCGDAGDADIIGLDFLHVEVKRVEPKNFNIAKFMQQAIDDAAEGLIPIVAHRFNNCEWLITMRGEDLTHIVIDWLKAPDNWLNDIFVDKKRFNLYDELLLQPEYTVLEYIKGDMVLITMRFADWIDIYREWEAGRGDSDKG